MQPFSTWLSIGALGVSGALFAATLWLQSTAPAASAHTPAQPSLRSENLVQPVRPALHSPSIDAQTLRRTVREAVAQELAAATPTDAGSEPEDAPPPRVSAEVQQRRALAAQDARMAIDDMRSLGRADPDLVADFRDAIARTEGHESQELLRALILALNAGEIAPPPPGVPLL